MTQLIGTSAAARILEASSETVRRLADQGVLPVRVRTCDGYRLFDPAVVTRLAASRRQQLAARYEQHSRREQATGRP